MLAQRAVEDSIAAAPGRNTTPVPSQSPTMLAQMAVEDSIAAAPWRNTTPVPEATSNDSEETHESEATSSANEETHEVDKPIGTPLETALAPMWDEKPPYNTRKAKCDRSRMASNLVNTVAAYRRQHIEGNINPVVSKGRSIVPEELLEEAINAATFDPQLCRIMPTMRPPITPTRWSPPSWRHQAKKICRQWEQGKCKYGERCRFGHEWPDREADEQHNITTAKWWGQVPPRALGALPPTRPTTKPTTQVPDLDTVPPWHNNDQMKKSRGRPPPSFNGLDHVMSKTVSMRIIDEAKEDKDMINREVTNILTKLKSDMNLEVKTPQEEPEDSSLEEEGPEDSSLEEESEGGTRREAQKDTDEHVQETRRKAPKVLQPSQPNQPPPEHLVQASHQSRQPPHQGDLAPQSEINETVMTDRPHMDEDSDEPDEAERNQEPIISIFVQTLNEDIERPDIVDNIKVRITYHSTIVSSFMHDNEWFVRLNSAQQANRVCGRLNHCWILKHTILIRCEVCAEQD